MKLARDRARRRMLGFALALLGCNRTPSSNLAPVPAPSRPSPTAATGSARQPVSSAAPQGSTPAPALTPREGCAARIDPTLDADALMTALAAQCVHGMTPLAARSERARLGAGQSLGLPFEVKDARRCLRAAAAGESGILEMNLGIETERGEILFRSESVPRLALLGTLGPVCVEQPGRLRATVRVTRGSGPVALQVWQASANP